MRVAYFPENVEVWQANLLQRGGSLPVYSGIPYQRGHGLGSF